MSQQPLKRYRTMCSIVALIVLVAACGKKEELTLSSISLDSSQLSITVGGTKTFIVTGTYADGTTQDVTSKSSFMAASSGTIAKVSTTQAATIEGIAVGTDTITATMGGQISATASVTIQAAASTTTTTATVSAPVDPTNPAASSVSPTQITVSWTSGGSASVGHVVAYATGTTAPATCSAGTVVPAATIGSASSYAVTGLAEATTYAFRVCGVNSEGTLSSGVTISQTTKYYHRVFVYNTTKIGSQVINNATADAFCQTDATAAGLGGTYKAILSTSTTAANTYITINFDVLNLRPTGSGGSQVIATSSADFWDGTIAYTLGYTASGGAPGGTQVWTGTTAAGAYSATACTNWTSGAAGASGTYGVTTGTTAYVTSTTGTCNTGRRLLCIGGQ